MSDEFLDFQRNVRDREVWNEIVDKSIEGWFWATNSMHEFRIACYQAAGRLVEDRSFVFLRDGRPCGLVPLAIGRDDCNGDLMASYLDAPLPWPMVVSDVDDRRGIQRLLFSELERRVNESNATVLRLVLAPPGVGSDLSEYFGQVVREGAFVDASYSSHWVDVTPGALNLVRERYRRDVRKGLRSYQIEIWSSGNLPVSIAEMYMQLHVKDAGRVTRPISTYEKQVDLVRNGEGFWVAARNLATDRIVGMLLISLHKGAAYDASVAVDPDFERDNVSHMMKWRAIEYLLEMGVSHYELGSVAFTPTYFSQPGKKNYGISFFKDGWSRGNMKTVRVAEKFYSRDTFNRFWSRKAEALYAHFSI